MGNTFMNFTDVTERATLTAGLWRRSRVEPVHDATIHGGGTDSSFLGIDYADRVEPIQIFRATDVDLYNDFGRIVFDREIAPEIRAIDVSFSMTRETVKNLYKVTIIADWTGDHNFGSMDIDTNHSEGHVLFNLPARRISTPPTNKPFQMSPFDLRLSWQFTQ